MAPVNAPAEAELDPHVRARGLVVGEGAAAHVVSSLRAATGDGDGDRPGAPGLGDDTLAVLAEAGFPGEEIDALEAERIVARSATPEATARAARLGNVLAWLATRDRPAGPAGSDGQAASAAPAVSAGPARRRVPVPRISDRP